MSEALPRCVQGTLWDTDDVTSSPGLGDGQKPCASPVGPNLAPSGPAVAPASRSRERAREKARKINAICGRHSFPSSASVALTASLGSRLVELLDTDGSMECELT